MPSGNSPLETSEPGEFTRMLQSPLAPTGPASQAPSIFSQSAPSGSPMAPSEPGEFTRMLQSPGIPSMPRQSSPPPDLFPPASSSGGMKEAGEFTRMLNAPFAVDGLAGQPLAAPPPRAHPAGEATRAFQAPQPQMQFPTGAAPAEQGPSEFTKMFKAPPPEMPAAPEPKVVKKAGRPPIPKKKGNYLLWILIAVAVVLALALIIYLVVR
jgi:hypothetical protein